MNRPIVERLWIAITIAALFCACARREFWEMVRDGDVLACKNALAANPKLSHETSSGGTPPLILAAGNGHAEVVSLLLKYGADPNCTEIHLRTTPLHWASYKGRINIVEILVQAGANIYAKDKTGRTPYDMASDGNQQAVMQYLSEHGANKR